MGGVVAGIISDRVFQSRRGPVAAILYGGMLVGSIVMTLTYQTDFLPWLVILMSVCVIGVHGMLSGTASMDFGGKKNVGVAVGIIDGFVSRGHGGDSRSTYGKVILPEPTRRMKDADAARPGQLGLVAKRPMILHPACSVQRPGDSHLESRSPSAARATPASGSGVVRGQRWPMRGRQRARGETALPADSVVSLPERELLGFHVESRERRGLA